MRELQFFGGDPYITEWRGLICHPEMASTATAALAAHIAVERPADLVQWRGVAGKAGELRLGGDFRPQEVMNTEIFYLLLPDSWNLFCGNLPRNIKESLRKCYSSLAREELEFHLRVVSSAEEAPEALNVFFRLHAQRAAARDTVRHPDIFARAPARAFLRSYCDAMARREICVFSSS